MARLLKNSGSWVWLSSYYPLMVTISHSVNTLGKRGQKVLEIFGVF